MITEEIQSNKMCLFCASDYHLEMILLPFINERINKSRFVILTENNLEDTLKILLQRINIKEETKEVIKNLNWKNDYKSKLEMINDLIKNNKQINIIVNGEYNYIKTTNNDLKKFDNNKINIINCFHVGDSNVDIDEIKKEYKVILNTQRI